MISESASLASGQSLFTITFPWPISPAPDVVIPTIINTSADADKITLFPSVLGITTTGFTLALSGNTNTANYKVAYVAGANSEIFPLLQFQGKLWNQLPKTEGVLNDADLMLVMRMYPLPYAQRIPLSALRQQFAPIASVAPTSSTSPGTPLSLALLESGKYLGVRAGAGWVRIPTVGDTNWGVSYASKQEREATVALASGQVEQTFTFSQAFTATAGDPSALPVVRADVFNITAAASKSMIYAMVSAVTLSGFTVLLSAPPETGDYKLSYLARLAV